MKEFLPVKLQTYSVQTATMLFRYFLKYVPKTSCLKKQYFEKKSMVGQLLKKVATLQYAALSFMKKTELM